jgi:hypothetical protein
LPGVLEKGICPIERTHQTEPVQEHEHCIELSADQRKNTPC